MKLIKFKPTTPSQRHLISVSKRNLWKGKPFKILTIKKKSNSGRNNTGKITISGKARGVKKMYRKIDFKRKNFEGKVIRLE